MPKQKKAKAVVITIADESLDKIDAVAKQLAAKGLKIADVMPLTGVITGSVTGESMAKLEAVAGVVSVEADQRVQI
jgi:hypothetical protein